MIPIRDTQPSYRIPVVTYLLMACNLLVFGFQVQMGFDHQGFYYLYGLVPAKYSVPEMSKYFSTVNHLVSIFSYMFLHGGFLHFIGNMWTLYIFGDNVEEHFGSIRFLFFYIGCGVISGGFHFFSDPVSTIPTIGASGAIAGVMGAYFLLFPGSRILTLIPIVIIPWFVEIPALIFFGIWFLIQVLNATGSDGAGSGIAWWAHIGGFVAGAFMAKLNAKVPETGVKDKINRFTRKKHTPKLQMIIASEMAERPDLLGKIDITPIESITGTQKLITIPWGFYKPLYRVKIPPGVKQGTRLKLSGMGKSTADGIKGDMYLMVNIQNAG